MVGTTFSRAVVACVMVAGALATVLGLGACAVAGADTGDVEVVELELDTEPGVVLPPRVDERPEMVVHLTEDELRALPAPPAPSSVAAVSVDFATGRVATRELEAPSFADGDVAASRGRAPQVRARLGADDRTVVSPQLARTYPYSAATKLFMTYPNGAQGVCSGALVGRHHVLTAAHCIYSHENGGWASSVEVVPGYAQGERPFGSAWATQGHSFTGWTQNGSWSYDFGVLLLDRNIGDVAGWYGAQYSTDLAFYQGTRQLNHWPATGWADGHTLFHGNDWITGLDPAQNLMFHAIDTEGGSSGGNIYADPGDGPRVHAPNSFHAFDSYGNPLVNGAPYFTPDTWAAFVGWLADDTAPADTPDLADAGAGYVEESRVAPGEALTVHVTINNLGTGAAGAFDVVVYLSSDSALDAGDRVLGEVAVSELGPVSNGTFTASLVVPASVADGTYRVLWYLDAGQSVAELDESNNVGGAQNAVTVRGSQPDPPDPDPWGDPDDPPPPPPPPHPPGGCNDAGGGGAAGSFALILVFVLLARRRLQLTRG